MDMVLAIAAAASLAMALAMGIVLVAMLREERRRSEARVAALVEMADAAPPQRARNPVKVPSPRPDAGEVELRRPEQVAGVGELFAEPERTSPWRTRIAVAAVLALLVGGGGYVHFASGAADRRSGLEAGNPSARTAMPLELLSLRHSQQTGTLSVSGVVQNPAGAAPVARVAVTAFVFSEDGRLLASGRAPLDFTTLGSGDESPFVVTMAVTGRVARYRVGFRADDGRVIAHVDRRQADAVARAGPPPGSGEK